MAGQSRIDAATATGLAASDRPIVVKLGGSVVRSAELPAWLDAIAQSPRPTVVVPGGGALADEVRACQQRLGFGDASAHRMALLAMDQLAWAIAGMRPGFVVGDTEESLRQGLDAGQVAVWAPYTLVSNRSDIPQSWTITSDSLALWLAGRLGARACYVIKSIARKGSRLSAAELVRQGVVDEAFPSMLQAAQVRSFLLGRGDQAEFAAALKNDGICGALIGVIPAQAGIQ